MYPQDISFSNLPADVHSEILANASINDLWLLARTSRPMMSLAYRMLLKHYVDGEDLRTVRKVLNSLCNQLDLVFGTPSDTANALREYLRKFVKLSFHDETQFSQIIANRLIALFALCYCGEELLAEFFTCLQLVRMNNPILFLTVQGRYAQLRNNNSLYLDCSNKHRQAIRNDVVLDLSISLVDHLFAIHTFPDNYNDFLGIAFTEPEAILRLRNFVVQTSRVSHDLTICIRTPLEAALKSGVLEDENVDEIREHYWRWFEETNDREFIPIIAATLPQLKQPIEFLNRALRHYNSNVPSQDWIALGLFHEELGTLLVTVLRRMPDTDVVFWLTEQIYPLIRLNNRLAQILLKKLLPSLSEIQIFQFLDKINIISKVSGVVNQELGLEETSHLVDLPAQKKLRILFACLQLSSLHTLFGDLPSPRIPSLARLVISRAIEKVIASMPSDDLSPVLQDTVFPLAITEDRLEFKSVPDVLRKFSKQSDLLWCFHQLLLLFDQTNEQISKRRYLSLICIVLEKLSSEGALVIEKLLAILKSFTSENEDQHYAGQIVSFIIARQSAQQVLDFLSTDIFPKFKFEHTNFVGPAFVFVALKQAWLKLSPRVVFRLLQDQIYPLLRASRKFIYLFESAGKALLVLPQEQARAELKDKLLPLFENDLDCYENLDVLSIILDLVRQQPSFLDDELQAKMVQLFCQRKNINGTTHIFLRILIDSSTSFAPEVIQLLLSQSDLLSFPNSYWICYAACDLFAKLYQQLFANDPDLRPSLSIPEDATPDVIVYFFDRLLLIPNLPSAVRAIILRQARQYQDIFSPLVIHAVAQGNLYEFKTILSLGIDVNETLDDQGNKLLHYVSAQPNEHCGDMLDYLFDNYADIDIEGRNRVGVTPLHCAAATANNSAITVLQRRGANLNAVTEDDHKRSAFRVAYNAGHAETASYLLDLLGPKLSSSPFRFIDQSNRVPNISEEPELTPMDLDDDDDDNYERPTKYRRLSDYIC